MADHAHASQEKRWQEILLSKNDLGNEIKKQITDIFISSKYIKLNKALYFLAKNKFLKTVFSFKRILMFKMLPTNN